MTCSDIADAPSRIRGKEMVDALCANGFKALWLPYQSHVTRPEILNFLSDFIRKCKIVQNSSPNSGVMIQRYISVFELNTWFRLAGILRLLRSLPKMTITSFCFGTITKFVFKRKLIYDIDDALFHESSFEVSHLLQISDLVVVGGCGLYDYVKHYNKNVLLIPTSKRIQPPQNSTKQESTSVALTFISGPRQLQYLQMLTDTFIELSKHCDFELRIISVLDPQHYTPYQGFFEKLRGQNVKVVPLVWTPEKEKEELERSDIGLAPLFGGIWERYKCGFKSINYMSEGIPPVASAFGENVQIVKDGYNGYLCGSKKEWYEKLKRLIEDKSLREQMGQNALETAQEKYSIDKNARLFLNRLRQL